MAPLRGVSANQAAAQPSDNGPTSLKAQESTPSLRISGDALRQLVAQGTSGKTWPRMQNEISGRPPLPFKKKPLSPRASDSVTAREVKFSDPDVSPCCCPLT